MIASPAYLALAINPAIFDEGGWVGMCDIFQGCLVATDQLVMLEVRREY